MISAAAETAGTVTVDFDLDVPAGDYRIEAFTNPSGADPSGYGEGETFESGLTVTHTGSGAESFQIIYLAGAPGDVVTLTATEDLGGSVFGATSEFSATATVVSSNTPPTVDAGGPYTTAEGDDLPLDGTGTTDPDGDTLTYNWDLDNDGSYDDATGDSPTIPWASLVALGFDDDGGPYTIGLEVDDGTTTATDTTTLTITNTRPTLTVTGAATTGPGVSYVLTLGSSDPGADTITSWTIDWGDGTVETIAGNPANASHTYAASGFTHEIRAAATDEDTTTLASNLHVPQWDGDNAVEVSGRTGVAVTTYASNPALDGPPDAVIGPDGMLYVAAFLAGQVVRYDPATGLFVDVFIPRAPADWTVPDGWSSVPTGSSGCRATTTAASSGSMRGPAHRWVMWSPQVSAASPRRSR